MKLPGEDEAVKSYDLTQYATDNVTGIERLICKKQKNVVHISSYMRLAALTTKVGSVLLENLPNDICPNVLYEGIALNNNTGEAYRVYINTDKKLYIYPIANAVKQDQQVYLNISYIV